MTDTIETLLVMEELESMLTIMNIEGISSEFSVMEFDDFNEHIYQVEYSDNFCNNDWKHIIYKNGEIVEQIDFNKDFINFN